MPNLTPEERARTLEVLSETMRTRLESQQTGMQSVETKGTLLLGFTIAAMQIYLFETHAQIVLRVLAISGYGFAMLFGLLVIYPYKHKMPPTPREFVEGFQSLRADQAHKYLAFVRVKAFEQNAEISDWKKRFWWRTLLALIFAVVFSGLSLLF